jgi:hypothetical protein
LSDFINEEVSLADNYGKITVNGKAKGGPILSDSKNKKEKKDSETSGDEAIIRVTDSQKLWTINLSNSLSYVCALKKKTMDKVLDIPQKDENMSISVNLSQEFLKSSFYLREFIFKAEKSLKMLFDA